MFSAIKSKIKSFYTWWIYYRIKLNDYLPWLAILSDHIVLLKNGGFMVVLEIKFHDLFAAGDDAIETINNALNRIIKQFSDYTFYIEVAQRRFYPEESATASKIAEKIILDEQKHYFRDHPFYEKKFYLSIVFTPKSKSKDKYKVFFFPKNKNNVSDKDLFVNNRKEFIKAINRIKG